MSDVRLTLHPAFVVGSLGRRLFGSFVEHTGALSRSSNSSMPPFGSWESTVSEQAYDHVDYLSPHCYYDPSDGNLDSFPASGVQMDTRAADSQRTNTRRDRHQVRPRELAGHQLADGVLTVSLPPVSWNLIRRNPR
jgi:alpha-L-arabinofuranosidase